MADRRRSPLPPAHAICLEDLQARSESERYLRCVALPGRQPGLGIRADGTVLWKADAALACELWVSADERLIAYRPMGAPPAPGSPRSPRRPWCSAPPRDATSRRPLRRPTRTSRFARLHPPPCRSPSRKLALTPPATRATMSQSTEHRALRAARQRPKRDRPRHPRPHGRRSSRPRSRFVTSRRIPSSRRASEHLRLAW